MARALFSGFFYEVYLKEFHAHLYFDHTSLAIANEIVELAKSESIFSVGRLHEKNVGPHPMWSCQLLFETQDIKDAMLWLLINRRNLTWFIHPLSGDDLKDHSDYAIWMGEKYNLNLSMFN